MTPTKPTECRRSPEKKRLFPHHFFVDILPPMSRLILLTAQGQVTQADLENLLTLDAQIARLRQQRELISATVLAKLSAGAAIEPGPRSVDVEVRYAGNRRTQRLTVR